MSKPLTSITNTKSNPKSVGTKYREPSKDRNGLRKVNTLADNGSASSVNLKPKPSVKVKQSPSSTSSVIKKKLENDLDKTESKHKLNVEAQRNLAVSSTSKSSPKVNKKLLTATKSSSLVHQNTLTKTSIAPETPPSSRVTKTQYFPSKNLYSNVVKEQMKAKPSTKTTSNIETTAASDKEHSRRTLNSNQIKRVKNKTEAVTKIIQKHKPSEVKSEIQFNTISDVTERPRTATLKRGSIVNSNIAGPDIPISETPSLTSLDLSYEQEEAAQQENQYDYEDDFDSYESDFEEYHSSDSLSSDADNLLTGEEATTSDDTLSLDNLPKQSPITETDEERMLDSGNFDIPENKHKQHLDNIKESSEQENFKSDLIENSRSNMASLSDEGFEEGKSSLQSGNMQFINFADAQKKWKQNKSLEKRRKRGEEILNMIRLDHYSFTLIDMPPVSYDIFIRSYGKTNTVQAPTQTGDDDTSEEIQTDLITTTNKWTQFPVTFSKINDTNSNYLEIYKKEFVGVGDDSVTTDSSSKQNSTNSSKLQKFLLFAGQIILTLLEESVSDNSERVYQNSREIPFSSGYIQFDTTSCTFLKNRPIRFVSYCSATHLKILTVHGKTEDVHNDVNDEFFFKSIVCLWSILNTAKPQKVLVVTGELSVCCFVSEPKLLIFGGLCEGSVTIWDMSENNWHRAFDSVIDKENYIQQPSYTTEIGCGHFSKIVSIQPLNTADHFVHNSIEWKSSNSQICSLDEHGTLIIWGIITKGTSSFSTFNRQTIVPWSQISLVQNSKLSLKDFNPDLTDLLCTDMNISAIDPHHLFISTNYGYVSHCLATGAKANPNKYSPGTKLQANCLESCPFSPLYFFAGHDDGAIVLYSRLLEKPLMTISNKDDTLQSGIELLQWSHHKPCVFYAKDSCNTIHVWDLTVSDLYPVYSIPFKEDITCMKLSPTLVRNCNTSYMILAGESGSIHLHMLNAEHGPSSLNQYEHDMKKFLNYVSRL